MKTAALSTNFNKIVVVQWRSIFYTKNMI